MATRVAFVRLLIKLEVLGPVPVIVGKGVCLLVGESSRGPNLTPVAMTSSSYAAQYFHSGDLKEAIELAFGQGVPVVYAIRVLDTTSGANTESHVASAKFSDGCTIPHASDVLTITAGSNGAWGNSVKITMSDGGYIATERNDNMIGDNTVGPYFLTNADIVVSTSNHVTVNAIDFPIVYAPTPCITKGCQIDQANGTITFYSNEAPTTSDVIAYNIKYATRNVEITDGIDTIKMNNVSSLIRMVAKLETTGWVIGTIGYGETHLPELGAARVPKVTMLAGGKDGQTVTVSDWEEALNNGFEGCTQLIGAPETVAFTTGTCTLAHDLIPVMDAGLEEWASTYHPAQGFVPAEPNMTVAELLDLASGYSNRLLTIVGNAWDLSETPVSGKCIAVARAGKEAACALGESAALPRNAMNGLYGLLNTFNQAEADTLTMSSDARVDVIIKTRGIRPYVGITTDQTWQFLRTVDNRTINAVIIASNQIAGQFFHEKRTPEIMAALETSIESYMEDLKKSQCVRAYNCKVTPNAADTGRVDILLQMENIGHIERIDMTMQVGIITGPGENHAVTDQA
jgi:hypothetical protein